MTSAKRCEDCPLWATTLLAKNLIVRKLCKLKRNAGTVEQRNAITNFFAASQWAYWHWIDDFWIVQVPDNYGPHSLHDRIVQLPVVGEATILLFEFHGRIRFWGRANKDAWDWLNHIGNVG
jgi:hypothetical protein